MLAEERYQQILEILKENNSVKVSVLTKKFGVSVETVRRDLEYMENEGILKRVHGGAVLDKIDCVQQSLPAREKENIAKKHEIGEIASCFIREGQSLAMDASTTNHEVAKVLKARFKKLTVLTNYLPIINELQGMTNYTILIPGGILRNEEQSIIGDMAEENIEKFHVDTAFVSISGISLRNGLTDYGFGEVKVKKKLMEISQETMVLADSSKFDVVSLMKVCGLSDVDRIITDSGLNASILDQYRKSGVEVVNQIPDARAQRL